jgi:predicted transcriptional regulator of viral defense system
MQPMKQLEAILSKLADPEHCLFSSSDLQGALPNYRGWSVLLSRAQKAGLLTRVCRNLYLFPRVPYKGGLLLYHAAARMRAGHFNYLSLETVLSEAGIIPQIPMSTIMLMSSGRSQTIRCGDFGRVEFIHSAKRPEDVAEQLTYDRDCRLWRASVPLAIRDMKATHRSTDLIDWEAVHEFV